MTLKEAYELQRWELIALRRENKKLKDDELLEKLRKDYEKQIRHLENKVKDTKRDSDSFYKLWRNQVATNEHLRDVLYDKERMISALLSKIEKLASLINDDHELIEELYAQIDKLKRQINRDYENSSLPSSDKPNHKKIKNSREKTDRKPGAQSGHKAQPRRKLKATEPVHIIPVPEEILNNPDYYLTGKIITKQVVDVEIKVKVTEYQTQEYRNRITGTRAHAPFPEGIKDEVCYGKSVKALAFLLNNYCNVSIEKTQQLIQELTGGVIRMSKGMINHLSKEFSDKSSDERREIFDHLVKAPVMYSDFTGCRVNGTGSYVVICATPNEMQYFHRTSKGHLGIKGTPVEETQFILVHDHDKTYYSYGSEHQECLAHVLRYLKDSMENESHLQWNKKMHDFIARMIHEVKMAERIISEEDAQSYEAEYRRITTEALSEYEIHPPSKYYRDGYNLAKRMHEYQHSHLLFLRHPEVDYTDNLSERLLRLFKRKLKQAVTFRSDKSVEYLCDALSIIETSKAAGQNIYDTVIGVFA